MGNIHLQAKEYERAIVAYERAIALKPDYALAWNNRGAALEALNQTKEALKSYSQALQFNPQYEKALNNRRRLLLSVSNKTPNLYN